MSSPSAFARDTTSGMILVSQFPRFNPALRMLVAPGLESDSVTGRNITIVTSVCAFALDAGQLRTPDKLCAA